MAQLKDLLVTGPSRLIGDAYANKIQITAISAPASAGGTTYGLGTSGQVLKTNGTSIYWDADSNSDVNVTQTITTTSAAYRLLFSNTADDTTRTETARKAAALYYNPATKLLTVSGGQVTATTFNGYLNGTATTATQATHAATANSATTATQATHAATANSATTASQATHAATANSATTSTWAITADKLDDFIVSTYTIPATKGVRITYPSHTPVLVGASRSNSNGRLVLIGGGYGVGGTTRNEWQELISPAESSFTWSIPQSDSIGTSVEIMNSSSSGEATVTVWAKSACTFTEITALTTEKQNRKLLTSANYTDYTVTKTGTGASGNWDITATTASYSGTAGFATTASQATHAATANSATTANTATTAGFATTANRATTAGYASTAYGALYSSTASTAAKLGGATVGSSVKPIYLNSGTPTATEEMIPLLRTNVDFTATTPSPGAYYLDGAKNPVTDATEYGTVLTLPWRKTSSNNYSSQMMLSSSSGVGKVHLYARRNTSTPALGTWTTFLDDDNYTTYTVTKTGTGATGTWSITATTSQQATHAATANSATTATNAQKVVQTNQTAANDYRILLSGSANDTTEYSGTNKNTNLRFNPSTQMLSVGGSITATGGLTIAGNANLNGSTTIQTLTAGSLVVNGGASFNQIPTAPTPDADSNDTSVATTAFVMNAFTANDAMVFKGVVNANGDLPATHSQGWTYRVATSGTYANKVCEVGDIIICVTDGTAANNDHWAVIQNNVDGAVYRGTNAFTDANIIVADSTAGKVKSSGKTISTATATSSSTDNTVPTSKAVWTTIASLDGNLNSTTPSASKTLTAFSQTDGKVSATFGAISITKSQISDFPTSMTPSSHTHGNLSNDGKITTTATIASGDKLVIVDSDTTAGSKITGSSITFDGSTTTKALTQKGTWETFNNYSHPSGTSAALGFYKIKVDTAMHVTQTSAVTKADLTGLGVTEVQFVNWNSV